MQEEIMDVLVSRVTEEVSIIVKSSLAELVEKEVTKALTRALAEGEFYKSINDDMRSGLSNIYSEINSVKKQGAQSMGQDGMSPADHQELLSETTGQLDQVIKATEEATFKIMDIVETLLTKQEAVRENMDGFCRDCKDSDTFKRLTETCEEITAQLLDMMTVLSFQDLTGQRIKHTIEVLGKVEEIVTQLYVSTGMMLKEREANPEKDIEQIKKETREKVSQSDVDGMLENFGF